MALTKQELSAIIDGIAKADDKDKERLAKALKLKTAAEIEIETSSTLAEALKLAEGFDDLAVAGEKAKKVLNDMKKAKIDMANIDLEVAKATNDYIAEVEAGAKVYEKMKAIEEDSAKTEEEKKESLEKCISNKQIENALTPILNENDLKQLLYTIDLKDDVIVRSNNLVLSIMTRVAFKVFLRTYFTSKYAS